MVKGGKEGFSLQRLHKYGLINNIKAASLMAPGRVPKIVITFILYTASLFLARDGPKSSL